MVIPRVLFLSLRNLSLYVNRTAAHGFARDLQPHFRVQAPELGSWRLAIRSGAWSLLYGPCHM
jgi:hypothetical protein